MATGPPAVIDDSDQEEQKNTASESLLQGHPVIVSQIRPAPYCGVEPPSFPGQGQGRVSLCAYAYATCYLGWITDPDPSMT
jgi:hypothetical protein